METGSCENFKNIRLIFYPPAVSVGLKHISILFYFAISLGYMRNSYLNSLWLLKRELELSSKLDIVMQRVALRHE